REAALRQKRPVRSAAEGLDLRGHLDVFGEVEILQVMRSRELRDRSITEVREVGDNRVELMAQEIFLEHRGTPHVQRAGRHIGQRQVFYQPLRRIQCDVAKVHAIGAAVRQKTGSQRSDLARAEDQGLMHRQPLDPLYTYSLLLVLRTIETLQGNLRGMTRTTDSINR